MCVRGRKGRKGNQMEGTRTDEIQTSLKTCCGGLVCKCAVHEEGRGRERREKRQRKRRCSQLGHKRPRTHQERKRRVPSYDESIHIPKKEKGKEGRERGGEGLRSRQAPMKLE